MMKTKNKKICIVSSCGGHLTEVQMLKSIYSKYEHFYVINNVVKLSDDLKNRTYFITHSERDWKFIINLWEALKILIKERPSILISTGAGPIVPFTLVARFLFRIKTIYIETITSVSKPTMTGKIMYYLANHFYYQWPTLIKTFPKGDYIGTII